MIEMVIAKLSAFFGQFIAPAIGSATALFMSRNRDAHLTKWEVFCIFLLGILIAHYVGGGLIYYFRLDQPNTEADELIKDSIKLTIGLYGMGILSDLQTAMPRIIRGFLNKWIPK